jgi:Tfp pilus assembly pilus retraction ATPase PilT
MQSLDASLAALVRAGMISQKEAAERASNDEELARLLGRVRVAS